MTTSRNILFGGVIIVLGVLFLLRNLGVLPFGVGRLWPLVLVILGISLILNFSRRPPSAKWGSSTGGSGASSDQGLLHLDKVFGDINLDFDDKELAGGDIRALLGDIKIDLTKSILPDGETVLRVSCWLGDIKVYLPQDSACSASASVWLGDAKVMGEKSSGLNCEVEAAQEGYDEAAKRLRVEASLLLGDIKLS